MKNPRTAVFKLLAASCLLFAAIGARGAEPLALQKVMKDLERHMQTITDGIARGDWDLVEKTAPMIADHPKPPFAEKRRILSFVGTRLGKFKAYDGETHKQAQAVGKAAKAKDGPGVTLAFQHLQASCNNCHSEFREPFVAHFYGKKAAVH
ncbi:MAG: cytochrome c [Geothrix sp.]|nr:cytochrome c [Geothrix sp.]